MSSSDEMRELFLERALLFPPVLVDFPPVCFWICVSVPSSSSSDDTMLLLDVGAFFESVFVVAVWAVALSLSGGVGFAFLVSGSSLLSIKCKKCKKWKKQ